MARGPDRSRHGSGVRTDALPISAKREAGKLSTFRPRLAPPVPGSDKPAVHHQRRRQWNPASFICATSPRSARPRTSFARVGRWPAGAPAPPRAQALEQCPSVGNASPASVTHMNQFHPVYEMSRRDQRRRADSGDCAQGHASFSWLETPLIAPPCHEGSAGAWRPRMPGCPHGGDEDPSGTAAGGQAARRHPSRTPSPSSRAAPGVPLVHRRGHPVDSGPARTPGREKSRRSEAGARGGACGRKRHASARPRQTAVPCPSCRRRRRPSPECAGEGLLSPACLQDLGKGPPAAEPTSRPRLFRSTGCRIRSRPRRA